MTTIQKSRILVYRIGQLGDTIIALPAMWAVRKYFPSAYIALLSDQHPGKIYVLAPKILPPEGLFDEYIQYEANAEGTDLSKALRILPSLHRAHFDTLVYLAPRIRSRWRIVRDLCFFRLAGIRNFIAYRGCISVSPRTRGRQLLTLDHEADHLLHRLFLSGIPVPRDGCGEMNLNFTSSEKAEALRWVEENPGRDLDIKPLVGIGPGSKMPFKVWPEGRFLELGHRLVTEMDIFPIIFGGPEDVGLGDRLIQKWGRGVNGARQLNIRQAAAVLSHCRFYVGNDTGTMHLAAAVGTHCVGIFSARDFPGRWHPYGNGHTVLRNNYVPCRLCFRTKCETMQCINSITVEQVVSACRGYLEK